MNDRTKKCLICHHPQCTAIPRTQDFTIRMECPNCGKFVFDSIEEGCFDDRQFLEKAPALALERKLAGNDGYTLRWDDDKKCICAGEIPFLSNYPRTFPEKLDRVLMNIARTVRYEPVESVVVPQKNLIELGVAALMDNEYFYRWNDFNEYTNLFFADIGNDTAVKQTLEVLQEEGLVNIFLSNLEKTEFRLTLKGVNRALELQKSQTSQKAFLAMWFDETLNPYIEAATEAARQAGYILERVNAVHHNGQIMDKVLNMINDARFVISDLTCVPEKKDDGVVVRGGVRGGVYFEAGYAKGQNKQVILTCKDDREVRERIHFDLQQVNTIFWQEQNGEVFSYEQLLVDVLRERIIFTVGKGPLFNMDESQRKQLGLGK